MGREGGSEGGRCWDSAPERSPHLRGEAAPLLPPGDGGAGHTCGPAVQPHGAAFVNLSPLWAHLDPGPTAPCTQNAVTTPLRTARRPRAPPSALRPHHARGARPWPRAARRCYGHDTGTGPDPRAQCLADAGCRRGSGPSEGAGHRGPLMETGGVSTTGTGIARASAPHVQER